MLVPVVFGILKTAYNDRMLWMGKSFSALALASAAWLLVLLVRRASGRAAEWMRPLLGGVVCLDGIGFIVIIGRDLLGNTDSSSIYAPGLSMAVSTAIYLLKFGWLLFFLTFLGRFALPPGAKMFRRFAAATLVPVLFLGATGWIEFLFAARRGLFDHLQSFSDYFIFIATIGAGLFLRSRIAFPIRGPAAKAMAVLGGLSASIFLGLGLWWIIGESVLRLSPAAGTAFIPLIFFIFNGSMALWMIHFSKVLDHPEAAGFVAVRISDDLVSRWEISSREREIIDLVGQGLSNQDIASRLFISLSTVKKHISNIFLKTGMVNRVQLVRMFSGSAQSSNGETQKESAGDGRPPAR